MADGSFEADALPTQETADALPDLQEGSPSPDLPVEMLELLKEVRSFLPVATVTREGSPEIHQGQLREFTSCNYR